MTFQNKLIAKKHSRIQKVHPKNLENLQENRQLDLCTRSYRMFFSYEKHVYRVARLRTYLLNYNIALFSTKY